MKELNIIDRGINSTEWDASEGKLTSSKIDSIAESDTDNSAALNALPTPFARMYIFADAFRKVNKYGVEAGLAYKKLVSDCLDLFEILYNWEYHKNRGENFIIKTWSKNQELKNLKSSHPIIKNALEIYLNDPAFDNTEEFKLIVYKNSKKQEYVLGGSSPFTFLFTSPSLDKIKDFDFINSSFNENIRIKKPGNRKSYFRHIDLLNDRSVEFQHYMYEIFNGMDNPHCREIRDYVINITGKSVNLSRRLNLNEITDDAGVSLIINEHVIKCNADISILNPLSDKLIKIPFRIDSSKFLCPEISGDDKREYDFLLPVSTTVLNNLDFENVRMKAVIKNNVSNPSASSVVFTIFIGNVSFSKIYYYSSNSSAGINEFGEIVDLYNDFNIQFNLGIFPFIKANKKEFNDYYKVGVYFYDYAERRVLENGDVKCHFFRADDNGYSEIFRQEDNSSLISGFKEVHRTVMSDKQRQGSNYYEIFNTCFDALKISLNIDRGVNVSGLIVPIWRKADIGSDIYNIAVDLGTTNTFVAYNKANNKGTPVQFTIDENNRQMVMLHQPLAGRDIPLIDKYEKCSFAEVRNLIRAEFVPPVIGASEKDFYRFPIRTALTSCTDQKQDFELFSNMNIAFSYEKARIPAWHKVDTDLKWKKNNGLKIRLFIRELLYMLRTQMIMDNADPSMCNVIWFRPLSFINSHQMIFNNIWKQETKDILHLSGGSLTDQTESDAPYYYYQKAGLIKDISSVAVVDIGGGSTDYVVFRNNKPEISASVNFGCDILWGNGFNQFSNARENGIYNSIKDEIAKTLYSKLLNSLNQEFESNPDISTSEMINFWISNDDSTKVLELLDRSEFKLMYLYHYTAILYHLIQLMKAKGVEAPRTLIFSGNGSKYLDLLATDAMLKKIAENVIGRIYGNSVNIQLIMPTRNRKESTGFGGLYKTNIDDAQFVHSIGVSPDNYVYNLRIVSEIKESYESGGLRNAVKDNICGFIDCFTSIIKEFNLCKQFEWTFRLDNLRDYLESGIDTNLNIAYQNNIVPLPETAEVNDSMFFYPLIQQIFELSMNDIPEKSSFTKRSIFFKHPDLLNEASDSVMRVDSIYRIDQFDNDTAVLNIIENGSSMRAALSNIEDFMPVSLCEYLNGSPDADVKSYLQVRPGKMIRANGKWEVIEKVCVKFE